MASLVNLLLLAAFSGTQAVTSFSSSSEMVDSAATVQDTKGRLVRVMRTEASQHAEPASELQEVVRQPRQDYFENLVKQDESRMMVAPTTSTTSAPSASGNVVDGVRLPPGFHPLKSFDDLNAKADAQADAKADANATANATDNATKPCVHTTTPCPSLPPCDFAPWTEWSECSVTCGPGVQERHRAVNGDHKCIGAFKEEEECGQDTTCAPTTSTTTKAPQNTTTTPPLVRMAAKSPLTTVTTTFSECEANRTRIFYQELMKSQYKAIMDRQPCNAVPGPYLSPSPLAAMPGGRILRMSTTAPSVEENATAPTTPQMAPLFGAPPGPCKHSTTTTPCPVPECTFSTWSDWTACSATCGSGLKERHREKTSDVPCTGAYREELECREAACAVAL